MSKLLGIDTKILDDGGFNFSQNGMIQKVFEATGMDYCNGLTTPDKVRALLGIY